MKTVPVGLQLYTVRDRMAEDVPAALAAVKRRQVGQALGQGDFQFLSHGTTYHSRILPE